MSEHKQATWGGRFEHGPSDLMLEFSESVSFDRRLAPFDLQCSRAHAAMLRHIGILSADELREITEGLERIARQIESGDFPWDRSIEDVHMNIEQALSKAVPSAAKLHTARSRNDQIATDIRLFLKWACAELMRRLDRLLSVLVRLAEAHTELPIPGYTHLQRAQPVSVAHHLLAYAEMFGRDSDRLNGVLEHANVCPLGAGALAGTTLSIDRAFTARELGFVDAAGNPKLTRNSMDAVADRDVLIEFVAVCAICGIHFSRVAEDFILWSTAEFGFVDLPDAFCTGSSLMPQKKNPDSFELMRGKAARLQGDLQTLLSLQKGLPLTYNRDLQEDKPPLFDAFDQTSNCLEVLSAVLEGVAFNATRCRKAAADSLLQATDLVDFLVAGGVAFREAHRAVGELVALAERRETTIDQLDDSSVSAIHEGFGGKWREHLDLDRALQSKQGYGMPGAAPVSNQIEYWKQRLANAAGPASPPDS